MVLSMSTWFSASAVLAQLRVLWSLDSGQAAWLTIAVQLGFVSGALVSAITNLPDRVDPRRVVCAACIGAAAANALVSASSGPPNTERADTRAAAVAAGRARCSASSASAASACASSRTSVTSPE